MALKTKDKAETVAPETGEVAAFVHELGPNGEPPEIPVGVLTVGSTSAEPAPLAPHLVDRIARQHLVHLPVSKSPGRKLLTLRLDGPNGPSFTFRRGGDKPQLEHVINLTPPAARQLRAEGWNVLAKE